MYMCMYSVAIAAFHLTKSGQNCIISINFTALKYTYHTAHVFSYYLLYVIMLCHTPYVPVHTGTFRDQLVSYLHQMNSPRYVEWLEDSIDKERKKQEHLEAVTAHLETEVANLSKETVQKMEENMKLVCIHVLYRNVIIVHCHVCLYSICVHLCTCIAYMFGCLCAHIHVCTLCVIALCTCTYMHTCI